MTSIRATVYSFLPSVALLAAMPLAGWAQSPDATHPQPKQASIYSFAIAGQPAGETPTPSDASCPKDLDSGTVAQPSTPVVSMRVNPKLLEAINKQLMRKLAKKMPTTIATSGATIDPNTLVIAGCLTRVDPGNAAKRMAGMNLGASHLNAHVRILLEDGSELKQLQDFDLATRGANPLPPLGPLGVVTHAATESRETLQADAKRLADQIVKKISAL